MLFAALIERIRVWRRERATINALSALTERELADIGCAPADLRDVARRAARA